MTQQIDPWDIPHPSRAAPQPIIPRTPPPQTPTNEALDRERLRALRLANENAETTNAQELTPEAIRLQAEQYIMTQQLPPLGNSRQAAAARQAILNEAARLAGASGMNGASLATGFARYRNSRHTLQVLDTQLGTIRGNEDTALANAEQFLARIREIYPSGGTRLGNTVRRIINEWSNDPAQSPYNVAYNTFLTEYAKVVAGSPSGSGVLSDSARHEAMDMLSNATSPEAAERAVAQMRIDMENRVQALQGNIERGYVNLSAGRPASFRSDGSMLDEHGHVLPAGGGDNRQDQGPPTLTGVGPSGPSGPSHGGGGEHPDATTVNTGPRGPDDVSLNTGDTQIVTDPSLAGVNAHVRSILNNRNLSEAEAGAQIRQYITDRGIAISPDLAAQLRASMAFRRNNPGARWGPNDVSLDRRIVPQSLTREILTNVGDSAPGAYTIAAGNMVTGQQLPNIVGATGGDAELARAGIDEIRNRHPISSTVGDVSGGAMLYSGGTRAVDAGLAATERLAPSLVARFPWLARAGGAASEAAPYSAEAASTALESTGTLAPRAVAGDAAIGAYESPGNRLEGAGIGAATGAGFRGTVNTAARAASPTGGDLAPAYEEGVQPSVGQRMGGVGNRIEQAFQSIPILGGIQRSTRNRALDQWQLGGFNRALRNLPDEPQLPAGMEPGTGPHAFTQDAFDTAYDRVHQRIRVVDDDQLQQDLSAIREDAAHLADPSLSHFNRIIDNSVLRRLQNGEGSLTGADLQQTLSEVRRTARSLRSNPTGDRELALMLDDLAGVLHDNAARHSAAEAMTTLGNINRGYGMLVRIENAANRAGAGEPGEYTAKGLLNAERQQGGLRGRQYLAGHGLMGDYAQAGLQLGQTVADSGTAERLATLGEGAGTIGALGATAHSGGTLGLIPGGIWAANTLANAPIARDAVNWVLRPNRPSIRPFTDELRAQLQARAGLGSTLGAPAVVSLYSSQ